jgi:hypothetical protein
LHAVSTQVVITIRRFRVNANEFAPLNGTREGLLEPGLCDAMMTNALGPLGDSYREDRRKEPEPKSKLEYREEPSRYGRGDDVAISESGH